jgi:hypothetical protein
VGFVVDAAAMVQASLRTLYLLPCHCIDTNASHQGYINPGIPVAQATKFCTLLPDIYASSLWNLLQVFFLAPRIWMRLQDFWKICGRLFHIHIPSSTTNGYIRLANGENR